jgi:hypothetical protein
LPLSNLPENYRSTSRDRSGAQAWFFDLSKRRAEPFQTSPFAKAGFCQHFGSRLINVSPDRDDWTNVSIGSLDHPEHVVPGEHTRVESQLYWYKLDDDLPRSRAEDDPELIEARGKAGMTHEGKPLDQGAIRDSYLCAV